MLLRVGNTPREYAWGRRGAISALLGHVNGDDIEAELWFGSHPASPARLLGAAQEATSESLGEMEPDLPFLLKVLAAGAPLSLQAHPNAEQARAGFAREDAAGIPLDAPHRLYRDPHPKPELIVAVSERFEALCGFRPADEARAAIIALVGDGGQNAIAPLLARLVDDETVGDAFLWLLERGPEAMAVAAAIESALVASPDRLPHASRIALLHPGDPGVAGALLLNHVVLAPGEALYLPAGNVHAYLDGIGIELMAPSDNVLRGGLTVKHVDVPELSRVLDRAAGPVPRLQPLPLDPGGLLYAPDDPEVAFSLALVATRAVIPLEGPAIALCLEGAFSIRGALGTIDVSRGDAIFVSADERELRIEGAGSLYLAR